MVQQLEIILFLVLLHQLAAVQELEERLQRLLGEAPRSE
jgi:hypothetical protein